jgi:hypothetical protein
LSSRNELGLSLRKTKHSRITHWRRAAASVEAMDLSNLWSCRRRWLRANWVQDRLGLGAGWFRPVVEVDAKWFSFLIEWSWRGRHTCCAFFMQKVNLVKTKIMRWT